MRNRGRYSNLYFSVLAGLFIFAGCLVVDSGKQAGRVPVVAASLFVVALAMAACQINEDAD